MTPVILRRIARFAPPGARRAVVGAIADLKGLPLRLSDPVRRRDPWNFWHNVGDGDFLAIGATLLANLQDHAGLRPIDQVLDIGCGNGRVAAHLAPVLRAGGGYVGFDVSRRGIQDCRRQFANEPHMHFELLDIRNREYNARGRVAEIDTVFPARDGSVDLAFATSVFTHMRMPGVRRYLAETARVLRPAGRFAFTAFAIEPGREASAGFPFQPFDATSAAVDARYPERAIAHWRVALEAAVAQAGLRLGDFLRGHWTTGGEYEGSQDLFVAVKP
jgi:SAM-dependent methyltransferase